MIPPPDTIDALVGAGIDWSNPAFTNPTLDNTDRASAAWSMMQDTLGPYAGWASAALAAQANVLRSLRA